MRCFGLIDVLLTCERDSPVSGQIRFYEDGPTLSAFLEASERGGKMLCSELVAVLQRCAADCEVTLHTFGVDEAPPTSSNDPIFAVVMVGDEVVLKGEYSDSGEKVLWEEDQGE